MEEEWNSLNFQCCLLKSHFRIQSIFVYLTNDKGKTVFGLSLCFQYFIFLPQMKYDLIILLKLEKRKQILLRWASNTLNWINWKQISIFQNCSHIFIFFFYLAISIISSLSSLFTFQMNYSSSNFEMNIFLLLLLAFQFLWLKNMHWNRFNWNAVWFCWKGQTFMLEQKVRVREQHFVINW